MDDADRSTSHERPAHGPTPRDGASLPERVLRAMLRDRRFLGRGLKFRRHGPAGRGPASFVCDEAALVVRLDGQFRPHPVPDDEPRPAPWPNRPGRRVVHVSTLDLLYTPEAVATAIAREAGVE